MDQPPPIEKYKRALERIRISCEEMAQVFQALHDTPPDAMEVEEVDEHGRESEGGEQGRVQSISVLSEMSVFKDLQAVAGSVKNLQESVHTTKVWIDFLEICGSEQQIQLGFFGFLPDELIIHIFGFLDPFSLCRCACVSHTWNVLSADEKLWEQKTKMAYPDIREIFTQIKKPWKWIFQSKYRQFLPGEPRDGCGWHVLPNGNRFYGDWKSDKRHGWGVNVISNGRIYEGEYVEDKRNGWGVFRWPGGEHAGDTYIGEWKDSKRHGHGRYTWADGRVYDGKWQNDKRAGGRSTYPNGQCYEGEYRHGKRHGTGTTTYPTGEVFHGQFVTNKRSGLGSLRWPDGAKFEGQWHRGRRNGPGVLVLPDGRTFSQFWSEETFNMDDRGLDSPYAKCQEVDPAESRLVRLQNNGEMLKFPRSESPDTKSSDSGESTDMDT